ncbi:MAG TPA: histidine kinase N-terminal 7TM domain-containing protein, partial [Bryobacteraceae bacterium]|nr:histidine kinase N-terminal 7TM domain-containing protein [Bryobacteraceae bacterium]
MEIPPTPLWPLSLVGGLVTAAIAVYVWTRRQVPGAYVLFAAMVAIAELCITAALEERSPTLAGQIFWLRVQIVGYAFVPVFWFLLTLSYVGHPLPGRRAAALYVIPAITILLHWTNAWHHLYWSRVWIDRTGPITIMGRVYGPGLWTFMGYTYVLMAAGVFMLLRYLPRGRVQRRRTFAFLVAMALPLAANVLYMYEWFPVR